VIDAIGVEFHDFKSEYVKTDEFGELFEKVLRQAAEERTRRSGASIGTSSSTPSASQGSPTTNASESYAPSRIYIPITSVC
jgi:hypothetical protein